MFSWRKKKNINIFLVKKCLIWAMHKKEFVFIITLEMFIYSHCNYAKYSDNLTTYHTYPNI